MANILRRVVKCARAYTNQSGLPNKNQMGWERQSPKKDEDSPRLPVSESQASGNTAFADDLKVRIMAW